MKNEKGIIIILEGPSGVGKDAIIKGLVDNYPNMFKKIPSTTTRSMREGESQGSPYYFVSEEEFLQKLNSGAIFEHTSRHGQYRGMSREYFDNAINKGIFPVKDCDLVGVNALRKLYGNNRVFTIFITCPKKNIEERLLGRGDSGQDLITRLNNYDEYIKNAKYFDKVVENINLDKAISDVYNLIIEYYEKCEIV